MGRLYGTTTATPSTTSLGTGRLYGSGTTTSSSTPRSSSAFTGQDLELMVNILAGLAPGGSKMLQNIKDELAGKKYTVGERVKTGLQTQGETVVDRYKMLASIPQFLAGSVVNPALSLSELVGGPKTLGPWSSLQEQKRQLQSAGGGQVLSTTVPVVQEILALLGAKQGVKDITGLKATQAKNLALRTPQPKITTQMMDEFAGKEGPGPLPWEKQVDPDTGLPDISKPIPNLYEVKKGIGPTITGIFKKFAGLKERVQNYGYGGEQVVRQVSRFENKSPIYSAQMRNVGESFFKDLPLEKQYELRDIIRGSATTTDPTLLSRASNFKKWSDSIRTKLLNAGVKEAYLPEYFPRRLSQAGLKRFGQPKTLQQIMEGLAEAKEQGVLDIAEIYRRFIAPKGVAKKAFTEQARHLTPEVMRKLFGSDQLPRELEANPLDEIYAMTRSVGKRLAAAEEWGPKWEKINSGIDTAMLTDKKGGQLAELLRDRAYGQVMTDSSTKALEGAFAKGLMVNKLSPITGWLQNITQGPMNSLLRFGVKPAIKGIKSLLPGQKTVERLGVGEWANRSRPGISDWIIKNLYGMRTEKIGYKWAEEAGKTFIDDMVKRIAKNPNDAGAKKALQDLHIDTTKIIDGKLDPMEKLMGMNEAVKQTMFPSLPSEAPEQMGLENLFRRYMWKQAVLTTKAPQAPFRSVAAKFGILPAYLLMNAITGEIPADVRALLTGKDRKKGLSRIVENIRSGSGFWPFDLLSGGMTPGSLTGLVAGVPAQYGEQQLRNILGIINAKKPETKWKNVLRTLLNMPFVPMGSTVSKRL